MTKQTAPHKPATDDEADGSFEQVGSVMDRVLTGIRGTMNAAHATAEAARAADDEPELIPDGVYFALDEDAYHADPALGSTDIKRLLVSPPDYWWNSKFNPAKPEDTDTPSRKFGRAVHKVVLEGREAFDALYAPAEHPGNIKAGKDERENIKAAGKIALVRKDYDRIVAAGTFISANPALANAFSGGMPEVSVFWTRDDGVRCKCRIDYLKTRASVDLKSVANINEHPFEDQCRTHFDRYMYDVQAEHYREGRELIKQFVASGNVFGKCDQSWFIELAEVDNFASVFVFWQSTGAPVTWAIMLSPGNPILEESRTEIEYAIKLYRQYLEKFGSDSAWALTEPIEELDITDLRFRTYRKYAKALA